MTELHLAKRVLKTLDGRPGYRFVVLYVPNMLFRESDPLLEWGCSSLVELGGITNNGKAASDQSEYLHSYARGRNVVEIINR